VAFAGVMALVTWAGARFGLQGVAISWLIAFPLLRLIPLGASLAQAGVTPRQYVATIADPAKAAVVMTVAVAIVLHVLMSGNAPWQRLVAGIGTGAVTYIAVLLSIDRSLGPELGEIVRSLLPGRREGGTA
jgi:hypothetical protein